MIPQLTSTSPCTRGFTKKAINYTAKKAGLKPKPSKRQKYVLRSWPHGNGGTLPALGTKLQNQTGGATSPMKNSPPSRENLDGDDVSCEFECFLTLNQIQLVSSNSKERNLTIFASENDLKPGFCRFFLPTYEYYKDFSVSFNKSRNI